MTVSVMMKVNVNVIAATAPVDNESDSDPKVSRYTLQKACIIFSD